MRGQACWSDLIGLFAVGMRPTSVAEYPLLNSIRLLILELPDIQGLG